MKKKPSNPATRQVTSGKDAPMYVSWQGTDASGKPKAFFATKAFKDTLDISTIQRSSGTSIYENIAPGNTSVREGFDRRDWDWFRPGERLPTLDREIIMACMQAYERIALVHNVIDTMADFAVQGISLVHPQPRIQEFYQEWFRKVGGPERTERMLNMLYRAGNVVVRRGFANLKQKDVTNLQQSVAGPVTNGFESDIKPDEVMKVKPLRIPWEYTILNPVGVEVIGGELAPFIGKKAFRFAIRIPEMLLKKLRSPKANEVGMVSQVPTNIMTAITLGGKLIPLDPDKVSVMYYKKDDWEIWAKPLCYSVLSDLQMLAKLKLADLAALDGVISHIRVWKLGSLATTPPMLPTEVAIERLATMLLNNVGGGTLDLIWGPEIELQETGTSTQKFLGEMKYIPVLKAIYAGLGIPGAITGDDKGGFTNNFISLRTLTERLAYGRSTVSDFWRKEIRLVQRAMGFALPAELVFDVATLTDETAEKRLLIELFDRNLISVEAIQDRFGLLPEIEKVRQKREERARKNDTLPPRAGPFYNPQRVEALQKIFAQNGVVTPSELGVELEPKKPGEINSIELTAKVAPKVAPGSGTKGEPGKGRPPGRTDKVKRKQKQVKPRQSVKAASEFVSLTEWAGYAQEAAAEFAHAGYLQGLGKKNLRQLTDDQADDLERFKFALLCRLEPYVDVTAEAIAQAVAAPLVTPRDVEALLIETCSQYAARNSGKPPGVEAMRRFQAAAYASLKLSAGVSDEEETPIEA